MIRILNFSLIGVLIITLGVSLYSCQKNTQPEKESELDKINKAWEVTWERFYHPKTNQFYDYLISYEKGKV